ncbi:uncharacterized protein LOC116291491 [Actinia tenebrosa]|uniref:Uncharacterized protein LOC116291491 n=1 Tax=Actinia tenebrosa TaxID=6105 RepID=A0A6P8HPG2_ACTTE|nr:uncharacterized protein LOC116291491 [Actinia tenebrosa]
MVHVNSKMTPREFINKVASLFSLKQSMICVTYEFQPVKGEDSITIEIEENDDSSLLYAIKVLGNYSKLSVEVNIQKGLGVPEIALNDGKRKSRTKEVISEQLKREMGLHDDQGQRKRKFMDATWTEKCNELMEEDSRFLLEFDKLKSGMKLVLGNSDYLVNPFQVICPCCGELRVLSCMNQMRTFCQHLKDKHYETSKGVDLVTRLGAWIKNNFITETELSLQTPLPFGLISPTPILSTPRVRKAVLARDIS